ncbi:MAG: FAD-dependent monooxygenase [Steroidobacteraceae bacterium]
MQALDSDVLIVGAGPSGLTLANLLGRRGVRTLLIDSKTGPIDDPRAVSVDDEALRVMQLAKTHQLIARHMVPNTGYSMMSPGGRRIARIAPTRAELGFPKRNNVHQPRFEADLFECLQDCAAVKVRLGATLAGLTQDEDGVVAFVALASGETVRIRCRYLAACDGGRSTTRRLLDVAMPGVTAPKRWLVVDLFKPQPVLLESLVFADAKRPRVFIPGPLGYRRWEFMVLPDEDPEHVVRIETVRALLRKYGDDADAEIRSVRVYTFHGRCAQQWRSGRVFLLGDAAHLNPPFGGQGMINGIRDAANLAWKLDYVLTGNAADPLLDTYQTERYPAMLGSIRVAMMLAGIMMPRSRWRGLLQNLLIGLLYRIPATRPYIEEMKFRPRSRVSSGFIVAPDADAPGVVGTMCAQPSGASGAPLREHLDDYLGPGFALLVLGAEALQLVEQLPAPWLSRADPAVVVLHLAHDPRSQSAAHCIELSVAEHAAFAANWGHVLVIRPDRYVMAELSIANFPAVSAQLSALFDEFAITAAHERPASAAQAVL